MITLLLFVIRLAVWLTLLPFRILIKIIQAIHRARERRKN